MAAILNSLMLSDQPDGYSNKDAFKRVTKYTTLCFANFNEYFVEFMLESNIVFQYIYICLSESFGFQYLPPDLANDGAWNAMFDP